MGKSKRQFIQTGAGAAVVDISPRDFTHGRIWMSGYMPTRSAEAQADPITARALALGDGKNGLLIVTIDTCLVSPLMASRWAHAISRALTVPEERILIITTHTHSGPDFSGLFGGVPPGYYLSARSGIISAAQKAWASRRKTDLRIGVARHNIGLPRRRKHGETDIDRDAVVLQWRAGGDVVATLINMGCHGVVYQSSSKILSGDLPGAICRAADAEYGGVSLFVPRIQGDVNPNIPGEDTYHQKGNSNELERLAGEGHECVKKAVSEAKSGDAAPLRLETKQISVDSNNLMKLLFGAPWWSGRLPNMSGSIPIGLKKFGIGEIKGVTVPGEVLTGLGRGLISYYNKPALLFSYCGGYMGYMMARDAFEKGGYEPCMSPGPVDTSKFL